MINANELRIGNWVRYKTAASVIGFVEAPVLHIDDETGEHFDPIPLTHDILLKCGFRIDRIDTTEYKGFEMTTITTYYTDWDWIEESGGFEIRITANSKDGTIAINHKYKSNVKYLHELQNLYFALTNQELNIQL